MEKLSVCAFHIILAHFSFAPLQRQTDSQSKGKKRRLFSTLGEGKGIFWMASKL